MKPMKDEMLDAINCAIGWTETWISIDPEEIKDYQKQQKNLFAIRSLIEQVDEWKKKATAILCAEIPEYDGTDMMDFIKEIRDYGEGK